MTKKVKDKPIASTVIDLLNGSIKRIYIMLMIITTFFIISVVDSIIQREKIQDILENLDIVEETTTEVTQNSEGANNYIGNDGDINYVAND